MSASPPTVPERKGLRWWPALAILGLAGVVIVWAWLQPESSYQVKNLRTVAVLVVAAALLLIWWLAASRARWRLRLGVFAAFVVALGLAAALFRVRGVSGDLLPILEPRWARPAWQQAAAAPGHATKGLAPATLAGPAADFPQFLGPDRSGVLGGPALDPDWQVHPPRVVWRQPVGAAWSGWAVVGGRALTQEQRGEEECSTCYETLTGRLLWCHREPAHYHTTLGGEGPRCTPTVVSNRVFTLGATGRLNCLDLATGRRVWFRDIAADARSKMPGWGFAGSALVFDGLVVVSAGGARDRSLLAYRADTGDLAWTGGSDSAGYGSPQLVTLAGRRQILAFNSHRISAHDPASGAVLWEYPWGIGQPHVTAPVVVGADRILFSSGYGVGAELLEIRPDDAGHLNAVRVWKSTKMKSKFATLVQRDGFLFGLDDGVLACLDLRDGSQAWRGNRYGHGQGLLVGDLLLQMAEDGELVLLRPTPAAPNELHRFRVFNGKTWNPIALAGDILLVRTDQEAACLRVALRMGLDKAGRI